MINKDTIDAVVKKLVEVYSPLGIYLFGSYAWGKPNEDSCTIFSKNFRFC